MDFGFYKRASRGIKHRASAMPFFYPRKAPAQVAPAVPAQQDAAGGKAKQTATAAATVWSTMPAPPPPSPMVAMEAGNGNGNGSGGGDAADVDRRAAMYISRVQERLRRERTVEDWRMYY
ncbi:hypothetical protein HU200_026996 [Digitaria exilis]|uniref:Uncharacterized protein n=1 Tax=Digitaria exilis TaxID=1010633 RepID=A0A835C7Z1_9POAL|nr:hypothetical protein HU200_026996 [Digitaria exilis]